MKKIIEPGLKILEQMCKHGNEPMNCDACEQEVQAFIMNDEKRKQKQLQRIVNEQYDNALLAPRFREKTLDNYIIENAGQKQAIEVARWFLQNHKKSAGLILIGKPGTGKNHIAAAIARQLIETAAVSVLFTEAIKICRAVKETWRSAHKSEAEVFKSFLTPDLLIIDEVGVQFKSDVERNILSEIINDRYNWLKATILCSNLTIDELVVIMGERALERFMEDGRLVVFDWESFRSRAQRQKIVSGASD